MKKLFCEWKRTKKSRTYDTKIRIGTGKKLLEYKKTHQEEIDAYQKKYLTLLEKLQKQEQQTTKKNRT